MYNPNFMNPYGTAIPNTGYQIPQATQQTASIARVHGREGANTLGNTLGVNRSTIAVDETHNDILFCIATDATGFPTIKRLRYVEDESDLKQESTANVVNSEYVTRTDFENLNQRFSALQGKFEKLMEDLGNGESNT